MFKMKTNHIIFGDFTSEEIEETTENFHINKELNEKKTNHIIFGDFTIEEIEELTKNFHLIKEVNEKKINHIIFGDFTIEEIEELTKNFHLNEDLNEKLNEKKTNICDFVFSEHDLQDWIKQQNKLNLVNKNHQEQSSSNYDIEFSVALFEIYHKARITLEEEALEYQINLHKKYYGI